MPRPVILLRFLLTPGCVMIIKQAWVQASLMWTIGFVSLYAYYK
jgi:hypothetical protein